MEERRILKDEHGRRIVTAAFCCNGHPLVTPDNPKLDGLPTIRLFCRGESGGEELFLSPIQGDGRVIGGDRFREDELLRVQCPVCGVDFEPVAPCYCRKGMFTAIYLNPDCRYRDAVVVCNSWGCKHSFLKLESSILESGDA